MKKFISMIMAAAMVVTMVPATAFAANTSSLKVVNAEEATVTGAAGWTTAVNGPEIQITINSIDTTVGTADTYEVELTFDNAVVNGNYSGATWSGWAKQNDASTASVNPVSVEIVEWVAGEDVVTIKVTEPASVDFAAGDIIALPLVNGMVKMEKVSEGRTATVKVTDGDLGTTEEKVFASVLGKVLKASVKDTVDVAEEEVATLKGVKIEAAVGNLPVASNEDLTIKLSKGFEFVKSACDGLSSANVYGVSYEDEDELVVDLANAGVGKAITITGIQIEATTAKAGDVATLKVYADDFETATVEVATVIGNTVVMELVDADEDVPVIWNGVDKNNKGLTVDDTHKALEVKIKESFPGVWNMNKEFTLSLPEGVHVVGVEADDVNGTLEKTVNSRLLTLENNYFVDAYQKGDHEEFVFAKRTFDNTNPLATSPMNKCHEMTFVLELVADPDFVGDVTLTLEGAAVDTQEVTIAKFVSPMTIKAEQNDVIIDYRYTEVPTSIVITEAEAGLWEEGLVIGFAVERGDYIEFEDDATFTVNAESDMEIEGTTVKSNGLYTGAVEFEVEEESEDEAAVVTISDISLFMQRSIPAGAYDLNMYVKTALCSGTGTDYLDAPIYAPEHATSDTSTHDDCVYLVSDVENFDTVVKEAWVNVVTAGRDQDDASFTTKVVVPVGESYIVAGDKQIALDVPAYINADGYTMLPVRAVATALGINNDAVQWNQATKTVIIMYGQRIITMTAGQSVVYVSGTAIPAASSVEIVNGRAFLGLRDLATTLGVATINWDPATKVASLN